VSIFFHFLVYRLCPGINAALQAVCIKTKVPQENSGVHAPVSGMAICDYLPVFWQSLGLGGYSHKRYMPVALYVADLPFPGFPDVYQNKIFLFIDLFFSSVDVISIEIISSLISGT
jgi:hypothetical protein